MALLWLVPSPPDAPPWGTSEGGNCQAEYNPLAVREWPQTCSSAGPTQNGRARPHAPSHTDLVQRRRPQLPPASLCVGPQAVCAVCWGEWQTGWEGSLQRPTSDLRSKASSHVSGAVTAFPSPVPHRLPKRGGNREWSQATDWASKDETHFLLATCLGVSCGPRVSSSQEFISQVRVIRRPPSGPPSLPFSSSCSPRKCWF